MTHLRSFKLDNRSTTDALNGQPILMSPIVLLILSGCSCYLVAILRTPLHDACVYDVEKCSLLKIYKNLGSLPLHKVLLLENRALVGCSSAITHRH